MRVLSLFDGIAGARQALKNLNIDCEYYASEIDKYAIQVAKKNHPDITHIGDVKNLICTFDNWLYPKDANEIFVNFDLLIGGSPCFTDGNYVTTIDGQVNIKDIKVGDYVLTHKGRFRKVLKIGGCYNKTRIIKGFGFLPIETTDEHPFLSKIRKDIWNGNGYTRILNNQNWIEAQNLKPFTNYVATPYINDVYENEYNCDFWRLVGRFIGDGWVTDRYRNGTKKDCYGVKICCAKNELDELKILVENVVGNHYTLIEERTVYKFHISQKWFADFVAIVGRGASNKEIPTKWLSLPKEKAKALIDGYMSADGCVKQNGTQIGYSTISKKLAVSLTLLGQRAGVILSSFVYEKPIKYAIEGREVNQAQFTYEGTYRTAPNRTQYFTEESYIWKPIKENDPINEVKRVYNLEVEEDNSYVINGICVHNCQDLSIAKKDRKGLDGERSGLFYEYVRILKECKPKFFILENVASMSKESRELISKKLFNIEPILINSSLLTAQQRKRLYWIGKLQQDGNYKKVDIEQPQDKGILLKDILESGKSLQQKSYLLTATYDKAVFWNTFEKKQRTMKAEPIRLGHFNKGSQGDRIYSVKGKSINLSATKTGLYKLDLPDGNYLIRKLTPNECCRLQGFPDNYTNFISNTQAYKCLGNSFTVPVIEHILRSIVINY